MTLDEAVARLVALGFGTYNVDLFRDFMPPTPNSCVTVKSYGGRPSPDTWKFGEAAPQREFPRLQITVRGEPGDYVTPEARMYAIYLGFSSAAPLVLSGVQYWTITPLQPPFPLEKDGQQRYVHACNFELFKAVSA